MSRRLIIRDSKQQTSLWVAEYIVRRINDFRPSKDRPFVLGLPTGSSPELIYANLVDLYKKGRVSFKHVVTFNMDEYVGIPTSHPQSYHSFMFKHLFQHVDIPPSQIHIPSLENCDQYDDLIAKYGGIELFLCGVGSDGHIAFNEPASSLSSRTRIKTLTQDTIVANARFFDGNIDAVPKSAVTVGVKTVLDAREVVLIADGRGKAEAVKQAVEGSIGHTWTVTALQMHPKFIMAVDEAATEELRVKTVKYFKDIESGPQARGYLPSTEQAIILLRKLLSSELLTPDNQHLTYDGRKFIMLNRRLIKQLIELAQTKNSGDEVQNLLWTVKSARLQIDIEALGTAAVDMKAANYKAAYSSLYTITSLLFQNPDFNKLVSDSLTITRQALASGVSTAAESIEQVAEQIEPPDTLIDSIGDVPDSDQPRADEEAKQTLEEIEVTIQKGVKEAAKDTKETMMEAVTPERKAAMKERVRQAVTRLKGYADYNTSVSTITTLLKSYLMAYSAAVGEVVDEVSGDVTPNKALIESGYLFWSFISSFGEQRQWDVLKERLKELLEHRHKDPEFENIIELVADSLRRLLTDPDYLFEDEDEVTKRYQMLKEKLSDNDGRSLGHDVDAVIKQLHKVAISVYNDRGVAQVKDTTLSIMDLVLTSSGEHGFNMNLLSDIGNVLIPKALESIQYIPIPRLTLVSPDIDLLLEPIIFEPGRTINSSSFLPYRVSVVTTNEMDVFKGPNRAKTHLSSSARIKIEGLTFKAEDVGYIMKVHRNWLVNFTDSGIASIRLDEEGIDVHLDLEFTRSSVDELVILKGVHVNLHTFDFTLRRSKFSFLAWLFKPLVKPMIRKLLENSLREAIEDGLRSLNREMVYTRERLRATRIANPHDLTTFVRAVLARWSAPSELPVVVGVDWRAHRANGRAEAPFDGEYAPGSLVSLFEAEAMGAGERVEEGAAGGWKNACFAI
ncbi:hypothetical protein H072_9550 [Dactylellina haptotyla CBS 200.50]|uniref:glucosamine-6-phosphate deaminase n=1 Tax=Dactylellina haptotyla (strain CBS 200.50) TaxID=1284197 RepID=S8BNZ2_DACHA|nr:hypothetical protein H072_9550 [Dactylellina haptotyla CBS 200.50]